MRLTTEPREGAAARIFPTGPVSGCAFAVGVGIGVLGWFATLTRAVSRAPGARIAPWLRAAAVVTGALLVVGGSVGAIRALAGSRAD